MNGLEELYNTLPPILARQSIGKLTGGIIQPGTCANLDSLGLGVEGRFLIGKKVCYSRDAFIKWLSARVKTPKSKNSGTETRS